MAAPNQPPNGTRKSVTGFITKIVGDGGNFGFINDEIFFLQDNVIGGPVALNDRVFADCEYSENLPIKWNANSIKIIQRANASPSGPSANTGASNLLDSDPRRRQGLLNQQQGSPLQQQQQQQFNQPSAQPVANTYQQHRQQRQQQQQQILRPFEVPTPTDGSGIGHQQSMGLMEQPNVVGPEFLPNQPFSHPVVSQAHEIPPFQQQHDTPMGPPKITYTSQLGTAFVQGQAPMVPPPFIAQSNTAPPPILPNHQQNQRVDQRSKQNRFGINNHTNKTIDNRRDQDNRNRNRNDVNRSEHQSRNQETRDSQNDGRNYTSRSDASSRDRSGGRNSSPKREKSSRSSPPSHHPIRSRTSVSSERSGSQSNSKRSRRHYEPQNIPKTMILTNLNGWNMRARCSSSIHVPSDLKDVIVNKYFRLDVKNIPKPIKYKIEEQTKSEAVSKDDNEATTKEQSENTQQATVNETAKENESSESTSDSVEIKKEGSESSQITPPTSQPKSDIKLNHKYGVKVILISLPELEAIYKNVFGKDLDSYENDSNRARPRLDESISLLCNKGHNGGHSLLGGKFDPHLDGFVEGEHNEFERHGRQPDLIATCRRVVLEQAGLDLGPCKSWTLLSTFIYNNKSDYFSTKASIEYSYIYMPQIWTMSSQVDDCAGAAQKTEKETVDTETLPESCVTEIEMQAEPEIAPQAETVNTVIVEPELKTEPVTAPEQASTTNQPEGGLSILKLGDLKVVDLKVELDKRQVKYKPNAKKAELVNLLYETLVSRNPSTHDQEVVKNDEISSEVKTEATGPDQTSEEEAPLNADTTITTDSTEVNGNEVVPTDAADESSTMLMKRDDDEKINQSEISSVQDEQANACQSNKRKAPDDSLELDQDELTAKKNDLAEEDDLKQDEREEGEEEEEKKSKKKQKVELIKEPFVVRAREGQQQLTIVPLFDVVQVSRYDQFELSVVSNLMKESLVQHLSDYIFTTLVEDSRSKSSTSETNLSTGANESTTASLSSASQETNSSDTNNNNNNNNDSGKTPKQTATTTKTNQDTTDKASCKELPVCRYINLACAYFDSTHMGYLHADDLSKLFNNTGITMSKRALISLIGDNEKFNYKTVADLSPKLSPAYVYSFPEQFSRLPGESIGHGDDYIGSKSSRMIEYQGVKYDMASLIRQVRDFETSRVNMIERFNHAIENFDKQTEEIHVLEVNQKSLTNAIKAQNDEISELKRERDLNKKKIENLRKGIKSSVSSLNELLGKEDK